MTLHRFAGQTAIVTGAASGIGLAVAQRLAGEGARVCLWDRDAVALERAPADVSDSVVNIVNIADADDVSRAMDETIAAIGDVRIMVASAGITGPNVPVVDYPVDAWRQVIDVNLNGLFYCNRSVVPSMLRAGNGRIVNVASVAGKEGNPNAGAYSASKAGVIGFTKSLGKELSGTPIRVNCVTPAAIDTPLFAQMTQQHIDFMLSKIPIGRFGTLDEVTAMIAWLASDECSFSTGAVFDLSGGRATY